MSPAAVHLAGGNRFDDVRLDIAASFAAQDEWLSTLDRRSVRRGRLRNTAALAAYAAERRLDVREATVASGVRRAWFREFDDYWQRCVGGRPLTLMDFHQLRFEYRRRAQHVDAMDWSSPAAHVANWQTPENISATFYFVYRYALQPARSRLLPKLLRRGDRVLEYGCSLAPMYRAWRAFFSHVAAQWVLADLPTFPFHYARHAYAHDAEATFRTITPELLDDPLAGAGDFDVIVVQEVFEHLHRPRYIAEYLLDRLRPGGRLFFDYEAATVGGHNTPAGRADRIATLELLAQRLEITHGDFRVSDASLGSCIGVKRAARR